MITKLWVEDKNWNGYVVKDGDYLNLKKLNFFIGANNSGKSRFVRQVFNDEDDKLNIVFKESQFTELKEEIKENAYYIQEISSHKSEGILKELTIDEEKFLQKCINLPNTMGFTRIILAGVPGLRMTYLKLKSKIEGGLHALAGSPTSFSDLPDDKEKDISLISSDIPKLPQHYYFPILRGLRPIEPKNDSYKSRTIKDYFEEQKEAPNIVTGFELYELLTKSLLGEPEERARIKEYEEKLSDVFFDGQTVTLIPKYMNDTIAVKIGDEDQHPIYNLGDGLQQVIIVTSHAFLTQEPGLYFIEEPEAHMHPGLLRRLAIFLADETPHQYIMTTHSNHLFDLADDRDDIVINRVSKKVTDGSPTFEITEVSKDKSLLLELGVKPSSVYLANCTIWVEGITDRFYIRAFLKRYLQILNESDSDDDKARFTKLNHYSENSHYAFVEYQGGVLSHWNFDDFEADNSEIAGLSAKSLCSEVFLIADGDIKGKAKREETLQQQLGGRLFVLDAKEIENYLPPAIIKATVKAQFEKKTKHKDGVDITKIDTNETADYKDPVKGIGKIIDDILAVNTNAPLFAAKSGTIKDKVDFCQIAVKEMNSTQWEMPEHIEVLCEKIFKHIDKMNQS
ncbi:MAG: ATP-binding protein [Algicola sp.]|nr:ATP-binding protein [Algicola sp.]